MGYTMKKGFHIAANVCVIVLMAIMLIGAFVLLGALSDVEPGTDGLGLVRGITIGLLIFTIGTIIVASIALKYGANGPLGLKIATIILIGIVAIMEFIGEGIVYGILCLIPIGLEITAIVLKDECAYPEDWEYENRPAVSTTDKKIAELKHLKEIGAITEEQYASAIDSIVDSLKK